MRHAVTVPRQTVVYDRDHLPNCSADELAHYREFVGDRNFVFVGGMHHSSTTLLQISLAGHIDVTRLTSTSVPADEGQFLVADLFPLPIYTLFDVPPRLADRPPRFRDRMLTKSLDATDYQHYVELAPAADGVHMDERHELVATRAARENTMCVMAKRFSPYWELSARYNVEKSPANVVRMRFLQAAFGAERTTFFATVRHPAALLWHIVVGEGSRDGKWWYRQHGAQRLVGMRTYVRAWLRVFGRLADDIGHLQNVCVIFNEDLQSQPAHVLHGAYAFMKQRAGDTEDVEHNRVPVNLKWHPGKHSAWGFFNVPGPKPIRPPANAKPHRPGRGLHEFVQALASNNKRHHVPSTRWLTPVPPTPLPTAPVPPPTARRVTFAPAVTRPKIPKMRSRAPLDFDEYVGVEWHSWWFGEVLPQLYPFTGDTAFFADLEKELEPFGYSFMSPQRFPSLHFERFTCVEDD